MTAPRKAKKMMATEKQNCAVSFYASTKELDALTQLAKAEGRTRSNLISWILHQHLVKAGYIRPEKRTIIAA